MFRVCKCLQGAQQEDTYDGHLLSLGHLQIPCSSNWDEENHDISETVNSGAYDEEEP